MIKKDLVEIYKLGRDADIGTMMLHDINRWAAVGVFELGCLTFMDHKVWYVGFDRPLTDLMRNNLFVNTSILLNKPYNYNRFED